MIRFYPVQPLLHSPTFRLVALLLLLVTFRAHSSDKLHMLPLSLEERVKAANLVVEGEVTAQRSFWDADRHNIYTSNTIVVYKVFKGELQSQQLEIITEGGTVDLEKHVFSSALQLHGGQQGVFFLVKENKLRTTPGSNGFTGRAYGSKQGFIRYDLQQLTASDVFATYKSVEEVYSAVTARTGSNFREVASNLRLQEKFSPPPAGQLNVMAPVISSFSPTTASAGTGTVLTINGSGFGTSRGSGSVKFRNGDDGGQTLVEPFSGDYRLWTDTRIQVLIPSYATNGSPAGTGRIQVTASDGSTVTSSSNLTINYVYSNVVEEDGDSPAQPILINKNGSGGYTMRFAPSLNSRPLAREGFRRAMSSWICSTQINWRVGANTDINEAVKDGSNVVVFTSITANTLAQTISRYSGCRNLTTKEITWWLDEFDMEINQSTNWQYGPGPPTGNQFDFETVVLHELGHAHQLGHVIQPNQSVMHYSIAVRALFQTLNLSDIEGGNHVMQTSFNPDKIALAALCKATPTIRNDDGDCNLAPEITQVGASFINSIRVEVNWSATATPAQGIDYFIIERSPDGTNWTPIDSVEYAAPGNFSSTDSSPLDGTSFYRIRVVYTNSTSSGFSSRVRVISPESVERFLLFPNPVSPLTEEVQLEYIVEQDTPMTLRLYDYTGKIVQEVEHIFTEDNLPFTLKVHQLAAGMYFLRWTNGTTAGEAKLVKL